MNLEKVLEYYGLEKKQAQIYLACLELGSATAYKIAKKVNIPRSTCYEIMDILQNKGLVSIFHKKKAKHFNAEDPKIVINMAKEKIELLEKSLPQFSALYGSEKSKPAVRFYQGKEGMKTILKEILDEAKELVGFSSSEDLLTILDDYWPKFIEQRVKKRIPVRTILRDSKKAQERLINGPQELREVKIFPAKYEHHGLVFVWEDKISMFSFGKETTALVVESKELAQIQKAMFNFMWDSLE